MKNYTNEELMLDKRKKAESLRAHPGELVQGIVFSALTALEHLKAAKVLLGNKMIIPGYGILINSIEELGKINRLTDVIVQWESINKADEYKGKQKDHSWKLSGALQMFSKIISSQGSTFTFSGVISEWLEGGDPVEFMLKYVNPEAAENYHKLRLKISYTNFDGQRASSPHHSLDRIEIGMLQMISEMLETTLEKLLVICDKLLPIYMDLIRKCYLESDPKKITSLKFEINRRVRRTLPAFRKYMDKALIKETGYDIEYWTDNKDLLKETDVISKLGDIKDILKQIADLIVSDEKIDEIYCYPPLKDSAKDFYRRLSFNDEEKEIGILN